MLTPENMAAALSDMQGFGLLVDSIEPDGKLHRLGTEDKPRSKNGWYRAFPDGRTVLYGDWAGEDGKWTAKGENTMSASERAEFSRRMEETRKLREAEQTRIHAEAAEKAQAIYAAAVDCTEHPYLTAKGVKPVPGLKLYKGALVVPLYGEGGKVVSLQFIDADGNKRFLTGGRKKGCFFSIGKNADKPLAICEGLATGLSVYECTGFPVLVAFDAGNLLSTAEMSRVQYPEREITLAADNDTKTDGNPGVTKATAAALAIGGSLAIPRWEGRAVDWNDLHQKMGAGEVRVQFMNHKKPDTPLVLAQPDKEPGLHCVNAYDFLTMEFPERKMLLAPIVPRQGLCMLHAARGIGKTFASMSVAYAVASGGSLFGRWAAPSPARVLFVDGEMPARTLQDRLAAIIAGSENEPPSNDYLQLLTPDMQPGPMPNLATREGQQAIEPFLEGVELLVMDNLATLARNGRANDEESWLPVQGWLLELRRRGISVFLVHHEGKGGGQRGTSAKEDILDTVIRLSRPSDYSSEQGARFEVHLTKARGICGADAKPFEAQLFTSGQTLTWTTRDIEDVELEHLKQLIDEGFTIRDAAEEMGVSKSKVGRLKKKLDSRPTDTRISSRTNFNNLEADYEQ